MPTYRDKTFCIALCANAECPDKLTAKIINEADRARLHISTIDFTDTCKDLIEPKADYSAAQGLKYVNKRFYISDKKEPR